MVVPVVVEFVLVSKLQTTLEVYQVDAGDMLPINRPLSIFLAGYNRI